MEAYHILALEYRNKKDKTKEVMNIKSQLVRTYLLMQVMAYPFQGNMPPLQCGIKGRGGMLP